MAHISRADGGLRELALFSGAGGGILGGKILGWRTVCAVERDPYAASVLVARQNNGLLPPFPIWDDVRTFSGTPWRGRVDVVSGGFPCQDISAAGKGAGIDGERSGLWSEMARIIGEVRPRYAFVENSPLLVGRGLARVLGDLASMGFDARWGVLGAVDVGAPHKRDRLWIVAHAYRNGMEERVRENRESGRGKIKEGGMEVDGSGATVANTDGMRELQPERRERNQWRWPCDCSRWTTEPDLGRVADGVAARVDRLKSLGNGQVPLCAAEAWRILTDNTGD